MPPKLTPGTPNERKRKTDCCGVGGFRNHWSCGTAPGASGAAAIRATESSFQFWPSVVHESPKRKMRSWPTAKLTPRSVPRRPIPSIGSAGVSVIRPTCSVYCFARTGVSQVPESAMLEPAPPESASAPLDAPTAAGA